jgi:predicted metal-dependent phosphoesterase TrpH
MECFQPLEDALSQVRSFRNQRNERMASRLQELGLRVTVEDALGASGGKIVARPHFAKIMVEKGYVPDLQSAFSRYLARGAAAYVPRDGFSPAECVEIIRESKGLAVLAHPSLTGLDEGGLGELLEELKSHGLWGLECVSSHCSPQESYKYLAIAGKHSLFPTAGSDFHGANRPNAALGVQVSDDFLPWARIGVTL